MVARFRTLRWLAALLLIASPAVGGQLMPLLHPCAVESATTESHHGHGAGAKHQQVPEGAQCSCIGSCQAPAVVAPPAETLISAVIATRPNSQPRLAGGRESPTITRPIDRLPPPTAPPTA